MSLFSDLLADPNAPKWFIVHARPWDDGVSPSGLVDLYWSENGFTSAPSDTPANQHFEAIIKSAVSFARSMFSPNAQRFGGETQPSYGTIVLANPGGAFDYLQDYAWDGRTVDVYMVGDGFTFADAGLIASLTVDGLEWAEDTITLRLRDLRYLLDKEIRTSRYAGTGGAEGGSDLAGHFKPLCYGKCRFVEAVLVSWSSQLYQVHDGQVLAIDAVYERGAAFTAHTTPDFATVDLLLAATITSGRFATCLAAGYFRLGSTPAGTVTADVRGDSGGSPGYASSVADLIEHIAVTRAGLAASRISQTAVHALNAKNSQTVGIYIGDPNQQRTCASVFDELADSVGAYWGFNRAGLLDMGRLDEPTGTAVASYTADLEILSLRRVATAVPAHLVTVDYQRCWRPLDDSEIAGSVSAAFREFIRESHRQENSGNGAILVRHPLAREIAVAALFDTQAAAAAEALRLRLLYEQDRDIYRAALKTPPFARDVGDEISITWPRHGLDGGRNFIVLGVDEDSAVGEAELILWG